MGKNNLLQLIKGDIRAWAVSSVMDILLDTIKGIEDINEKIERLLNAPFTSGKKYLALAKKYSVKSNEYNTNLIKARDAFHNGASQQNGLLKCHSLYLAGITSELLNDKIAMKHYFQEALEAIEEYLNAVRKQLDKGDNAGNIVSGAMTVTGIGFLALGSSVLFLGPIGVIMIMGGVAGGLGGLLDPPGTPLEIKKMTIGELGFTVYDLIQALEEGLKK